MSWSCHWATGYWQIPLLLCKVMTVALTQPNVNAWSDLSGFNHFNTAVMTHYHTHTHMYSARTQLLHPEYLQTAVCSSVTNKEEQLPVFFLVLMSMKNWRKISRKPFPQTPLQKPSVMYSLGRAELHISDKSIQALHLYRHCLTESLGVNGWRTHRLNANRGTA